MPVVFNPFTGNLDLIDNTAAAGSDTQVQFNDGGVLGGDSGLVFNKTTNALTGGAFIPNGSTVPVNGMYLPAANSVALSTNGTGRLFVDAAGNVGIGPNGAGGYDVLFNPGTSSSPLIRDSSGRLLVGTSSTSSNNRLIVQSNTDSSTGPATLFLAKGDNAPNSGASLGLLRFGGSTHVNSAEIYAFRDGGTWTAGSSLPTALAFSTTADGASSPTERMRIDNRGAVRTGNNTLYTGTTGAVTASTGTIVFSFDFSGTTTRHTTLIKLSVMHLVETNSIAAQPAAQYIFAVQAYTNRLSRATTPTAAFENVYVAATHFAFADTGNTSFTVTLTNPSASAASAVYYKVEVLDEGSALNLSSVATT